MGGDQRGRNEERFEVGGAGRSAAPVVEDREEARDERVDGGEMVHSGSPIIAPAGGGCKRLSDRTRGGMIDCHTVMPKTKVALTLDAALIDQVDELVARQAFRNRSQAVEAALADKLRRLARTRLAREAAKLDPRQEKRLADEGLVDPLDAWPEY
jgi:Arc/MetJ-type ribon-helix-helix transcriptional regulator